MVVDCLISPGYFAVFCSVFPASIEVGLFIRKQLSEAETIASLYDPYEQINYEVVVPPTKIHAVSNLILLRHAAI